MVGGRWAVRASNRDIYPEILKRDENTRIKIIRLDRPMTKDKIREVLADHKDFKDPKIQAVLKRGDEATVKKTAAKKAAVKSTKTRRAPKPVEAASQSAAA